jgi:signal transduction histidine kinase
VGAATAWLLGGSSWRERAVAATLSGGALLAGIGSRTPEDADEGARRAIEEARLEVARAREERDALQRGLAHDLRSPLGAIVNFVAVLEDDHGDRLDAEARGLVARIRRAAEGGLRLAEGLSRLARVSEQALARERVDVEPLVRQTFGELSASSPRVELSVGELPAAVADRALLREAFAELLSNALKFSAHPEQGRIAVGGRRTPQGGVVYWVADDGVGFDPASAPRLFHPFERLHARDDFPGAGIGLSVVRRIAERHGGTVSAEARPGCGACFFLALPSAEDA